MSVRFTSSLPLHTTEMSASKGLAQLSHGELALGKVSSVSPDGVAVISFPEFEAQTQTDSSLKPGEQVFAAVQKTRDQTLLNLLPNIEEGEILNGAAGAAHRESLFRFGEREFKMRLPAGEAAMPAAGAPIRAQLQVIAGKPYLQMLPESLSGDVIEGIVATVKNDGSALLDVGGTPVLAKAAGILKAGEIIGVTLRQIGDKLTLEILPGFSAPSSVVGTEALSDAGGSDPLLKLLAAPQYTRLLQALASGELKIGDTGRELAFLLQQALNSSMIDRAGWLPTLARVLDVILLSPMHDGFIEQLSAALRDSGIFFESRALQAAATQNIDPTLSGDLKPALLLANQKLSEMIHAAPGGAAEPPPLLDEIAARVGRLLDLVTAEQFQNVRLSPTGQIYVQLPFAEGADLDRVEIRISPHGKKEQKIDPRNVSITLAITTSRLGRIKVSVSIVEGQVSCQFRASRKSVAELLETHADMLRLGLEKLDYRVAHIGCLISNNEKDFTVFDNSATIPHSGLDVRI
ncbi:flagellar hook-length control protein FliK [Candidatus Poribacteria bacterium]|nr:flagellar hook-length control protein FliK [Candidatus Poribacteria bacterium]